MQGCFYQNRLADRAQSSEMAKVYRQQFLFTFSPIESFRDTRCQIDSEKVQCVTVERLTSLSDCSSTFDDPILGNDAVR